MARFVALASAALLFAGSAAVGQGLSASDPQLTMGVHGPKRTDASFLPGDAVTLRFDVAGLAPDSEGRVRFGVITRVEDAAGKALALDSQELGPIGLPFGAGKLRHSVSAPTPIDLPPGEYVLKVTLADRGAKAAAGGEAKLEKKFTVKKPDFGLVRPQVTADALGKTPVAPHGSLGQTLHFHVVAVGFEADKTSQSGNLTVELAVLDEKGQPTGTKPIVVDLRDLPKETKFLPLRLDLPLTRAGSFRVQVKATDLATKKTAMLVLPLRAVDD